MPITAHCRINGQWRIARYLGLIMDHSFREYQNFSLVYKQVIRISPKDGVFDESATRRKCTNRALLWPDTPQTISKGRRVDWENISHSKVVGSPRNCPSKGPKRGLKTTTWGCCRRGSGAKLPKRKKQISSQCCFGPRKIKKIEDWTNCACARGLEAS
jgi:hypothetical protein